MPQAFEPNGSRLVSHAPYKSDHLTKRPHAPIVRSRTRDQLSNEIAEQLIVRPLFYHEPGKSFFGYQSNILILRSGGRHLHARRLQSFFKGFKVFRGGNDDDTLARLEAATNESHQRVQQHSIVFVELSYVFTRSNLAPEYLGPTRLNIRHCCSAPFLQHWVICVASSVRPHPPTGGDGEI